MRLLRISGSLRLTLLGRSIVLLTVELAANVVCWVVAGILFGRHAEKQPILTLALLAWTIGLRHALDADHISAIDNATRGLIALGQLPVTCGLYFSLGHSTIVLVVNIAIAISTDIYNKIDRVGSVGGIVGAAVSASFLFLIGFANSVLLWRILKDRRKAKRRRAEQVLDGDNPQARDDDINNGPYYANQTFMMRILGPVITFVDRPWKMYPVGFLFGFGFDTASSIALLAISAIAKKDSNGKSISPSHIIILPLLFTAGMTLVDSLDSIIMLYSYSGFPERGWAIFERRPRKSPVVTEENLPVTPTSVDGVSSTSLPTSTSGLQDVSDSPVLLDESEPEAEEKLKRDLRVKTNMMSNLSIILTSMSILVAFSISLITIMGLIGDNCKRCKEAADSDDGRLSGRFWRFWSNANDNSGFIGAAIVGAFIVVVAGWYSVQWAVKKIKARSG